MESCIDQSGCIEQSACVEQVNPDIDLLLTASNTQVSPNTARKRVGVTLINTLFRGRPLMIWGAVEIEKKKLRPFSRKKNLEGLSPGKKIGKAFSRKKASLRKKNCQKAFGRKKNLERLL